MTLAFEESIKANKKNEIPVGAIIVRNNKVISKSHNNRQKKYNVLGHAEINAILKAEKKIKDWRLDDCDLYVTLEPCDMCISIIKESRIKNVYYLAKNTNKSSIGDGQLYDNIDLKEKYEQLLKNYFKKMR